MTTLAEKFDVVIDNVGNIGIPTGKRMLTADGVMILIVGDLSETLRARGNVKGGPSPERAESFTTLLGLVADGALTVVNQDVLDLEDIAHAHEIVDSGRKVGNIIIKLT